MLDAGGRVDAATAREQDSRARRQLRGQFNDRLGPIHIHTPRPRGRFAFATFGLDAQGGQVKDRVRREFRQSLGNRWRRRFAYIPSQQFDLASQLARRIVAPGAVVRAARYAIAAGQQMLGQKAPREPGDSRNERAHAKDDSSSM
jgi:hypothetical protein